jgi:hypothetical protein
MKDSDVPEITYAWWKQNQPTTLPSTGLGEALKSYESVRSQAKVNKDIGQLEATLKKYDDALKEVETLRSAVQRAISKCNKVVHKTCIKVLSKYDGLLDKETQALEVERQKVADLAADRFEAVESECEKIFDLVKDAVLDMEKKMADLEKVVHESEETREQVAHAVAAKEQNAGELEVSITQGYLRDGQNVLAEMTKLKNNTESDAWKSWKVVYDKDLEKIDQRRILRLQSALENKLSPVRVAVERAEKMVDQVASVAKAVHQMADGAGDIEDHFVEVCNALADRMIKGHAVIAARLREVGGTLDKANFDAMKFREVKEPESRDPQLLESSKSTLRRAIGLLDQADKELTKAQQVFDGTVSKLPKFAVRTNKRFKETLEQLGDVAAALHDDRKEVGALKDKSKSVAESYQKSATLMVAN